MPVPGFFVPASIRVRCTFPVVGPVTCAVSGGADSLAMLILARDAGLETTAIHVDHGLRPGGDREADRVAEVAARVGARFESRRVEVEPGGDLEARRRARHDALPPDTLFGHTADDQAETVLLALLRGAGLDGAAGISADRHPILQLRRSETEALCRAAGLRPLADPTNTDPRFRRNRVRHEVLPLLADVAERDVVPLLTRFAALARADTDHLDALASSVDPTDAASLRDTAPPLARRAIHAWLRTALPEGHPPDAAAVDRVLGVAANRATATEVAGGIRVRRSGGRLLLEQRSEPVGDDR